MTVSLNALLVFGFLTEKRDLQCDEADEVVDYHELGHEDFESPVFLIDARATLVLVLNLDLVVVVVLVIVLMEFGLLHGNLIL